MTFGIGIDTGGTYTDAVIYDHETHAVLAKSKSPTTREDLATGIRRALEQLPEEMIKQAEVVSLSTTLATNACIENMGGRAKLILMGTNRKTLEWIGADKKYGLCFDDVLCIETNSSYDGKIIDHPDWQAVMDENAEFFDTAEALSIAELNSRRNGGVIETAAKEAIGARYNIPIVAASELVSGINVVERGATALLNARLLPVVDRFMKAVKRALDELGIKVKRMIVRSDGSLMGDEFARFRPVETILSGPAASVMGSRALANIDNCLVIDMGGTTTDISVVRRGVPEMTGGINIGGWRTQVKGVFIDTFGLGGDTRICMTDGRLVLDTRRVEPLCAAASKYPGIESQLEQLLEKTILHTRPLHEFLYLVRNPENTDKYSAEEVKLIRQLSAGPQMIGGDVLDMYSVPSERLEREGIVIRCGLTPTDIMHLKGDYSVFEADASRLAARYFLRALPVYEDCTEGLETFCEDVYDLVRKRLFENIARVFIEAAYPKLCAGGMGDQLKQLIEHRWNARNEPAAEDFFDLKFNTSAALVGIGAPTHIFLPGVAKVLGAECIIPEHSAVANALGAAVADIRVQVNAEVTARYEDDFLEGYSLFAPGVSRMYGTYSEAVEAAKEVVEQLARGEAIRRGAFGEVKVEIEVKRNTSHARSGAEIDLGTLVRATVNGSLS